MADLADAITDLAAAPASAEVDGAKVKERPLPELIAADVHLQAKAGAARKTRGLRFTRLIPPGARGGEPKC